MWLFKKRDSDYYHNKSDEDLIILFKESGDKSVFSELFKKHVTTIYGTCLFYLEDKDEAKDAVMNIFEKLLPDLRTNNIKNFKAWLSFVVRNHCISLIRKKKTANTQARAFYEFEYVDTTYEDELKLEKINDDILLQYMQESLPQLKEGQRRCVELFYLRNLSYQQINEETGYSINEVKSNIQNGKRNLKLLIEGRLQKKSRHD